LADYHFIPHTQLLAESLKSCLQESEPLPRDFTQMFNDKLFKFDTNHIPDCIRLYEELGEDYDGLLSKKLKLENHQFSGMSHISKDSNFLKKPRCEARTPDADPTSVRDAAAGFEGEKENVEYNFNLL
jgi:hypothetical protein